MMCFHTKLCSRLLELAISLVERQQGLGIHEKFRMFLQPKRLLCVDLST